jgi:hypothetical protein
MTVFEHPRWPALLGYLFIRRGRDGVNGARHRLEVRQIAPSWVFDVESNCAHCGRRISNVRIDARGGWTFNLSCPLAVDPKCARMPETTAACQRVRDLIAGRPTPPGLFEGTP